MDYQGNANKNKQEPKPKKEIVKVVTTEVVVKKKSLGSKFRDVFIAADFRSVNHYIIFDVLIPALRDMVSDAGTKGLQRIIYGESAIRRRDYGPGPRVTYNRPVDRSYHYQERQIDRPIGRTPPSREPISPRHTTRDDFILSSREDAALVLERMNDIIETYEVVSVADLRELLGLPSTPVDNSWGWIYLGDAQVQQIREGYLLNLPPAEPIQSIQ